MSRWVDSTCSLASSDMQRQGDFARHECQAEMSISSIASGASSRQDMTSNQVAMRQQVIHGPMIWLCGLRQGAPSGLTCQDLHQSQLHSKPARCHPCKPFSTLRTVCSLISILQRAHAPAIISSGQLFQSIAVTAGYCFLPHQNGI